MPFLRERSGKWSAVKIAACAVATAPALWLAWRAANADLGPRPLTEAIHESGLWAVRLLWLALAVTPARRILAAPRLILARRTLGVAACAYTLLHLTLYAADLSFDLGRVVSEIVLRIYLTIGAVALIGLIMLASTSWDGAIARLGSMRWNALHRLVYALAVLASVHFFLQSKIDVWEATLMAGLLLSLFGYRLLHRVAGDVTPARLLALAVAAAALTALGETAWYAAATGVDAWRILAAQFDLAVTIRPAWWVLLAGLMAAACGWRWSRARSAQVGTRLVFDRAL
jgi:sulfoxide reductase heme-binding subunit YedZ